MAWGMGLLAVAIVAPAATALVALLAVVAHVRQQRDLAGPLDGSGDLVLVPAARNRDAPPPDLAAVGDVLAERADVLVVDLVDLVPAEAAGLAATGPRTALLVSPARRPAALLRHCLEDLAEEVVPREHRRAIAARARGLGV